jgi:hypothetical protein
VGKSDTGESSCLAPVVGSAVMGADAALGGGVEETVDAQPMGEAATQQARQIRTEAIPSF